MPSRTLLPPLLCLPLVLGLIACGSSVGEPHGDQGGGQRPDPVVVDFPIAYVVRPVPRDEDGAILPQVLTAPADFHPGARLYLQDRATATSGRRHLTKGLFAPDALYDVKDLSVHPDGNRLLFALRAPQIEDADDDEQPSWNIWEYRMETGQLHRLMRSDTRAEAGQDIAPAYLPDGRIVFSSTRQSRSRAVLLDDGKPQYAAQTERDNQPAFVLHTMDSDGANIEQISYNQSHDLQPTLLPNGRILFTRWDGFNHNRLSLYSINPDGTGLGPHYGYHSLNEDDAPNLFRPRIMRDGRGLAIAKPRADLLGGDLVTLDLNTHVENQRRITGEEAEPTQRSLASAPVALDGNASRPGLYHSAYPLHDGSGRYLVSWSQCRLNLIEEQRLVPCTDDWLATEGAEPAAPLFGLWIFNPAGPTQQPVVVGEEGWMVTEPLALEPRTRADYRAPILADSNQVSEGVGILHIQSLYLIDGEDDSEAGIDTLADPGQTQRAERPAQFLRILKAVSRPDNDTLNDQDDEIFGNRFNQNNGLLEILGYVPIEPDGSVKARLPADVAFSFEVVDAQGERLGRRHNHWLQLRPGEQRHCQGCHDGDSEIPHGHPERGPEPAYLGAITSGQPFPNTQRLDPFGSPETPDMGETMAQFDARIAFTCTNPDEPDSCRLRGPRTPSVNLIYQDIWTDPAVRDPDPAQEFRYTALVADDYREYRDPENPGDGLTVSEPRPPVSTACQQQWTSQCRTVINYENHIQPLWERQRLLTETDGDGQPQLVTGADDQPVEHTCVLCHSRFDERLDTPRIPPGQLELTDNPGNNGQMTSYLELLNQDVELTLIDGAVTPLLVETGEFQVDNDGELILDENGEPIPITTTVPVEPSLSRAGAANSQRFFERFAQFNEADSVDHRDMLNPEEMRLLREWLDTGARYYNNPFDRASQDEE